jgi:hypothetical protein
MTVLARWWVVEKVEGVLEAFVFEADAREFARDYDALSVTEAVHADYLRGAVDLLREIAESDPVDNALDPDRNRRLARSFFVTSTTAGGTE